MSKVFLQAGSIVWSQQLVTMVQLRRLTIYAEEDDGSDPGVDSEALPKPKRYFRRKILFELWERANPFDM